MNDLEKALAKTSDLSQGSLAAITGLWQKRRTLKSREVLVDLHHLDTNLYFVEEGCLRLYVIDEKGDEKNIGFGYAGSFITNFQSYVSGEASQVIIEAALPTVVVAISKKEILGLVQSNFEISHWYQYLLEKTLSGHIQRQIELLTLPPKERYLIFQKRSGHLINSIPLKMIASYLMMTPETISRIRSDIS